VSNRSGTSCYTAAGSVLSSGNTFFCAASGGKVKIPMLAK
jgi:hypothetical protein